MRLIAVPSGVRGSGAAARAELRVLIVPRLDEAGLVADSVMADWPTQLAASPFEVLVRGDAGDTPRPVRHERLAEANRDVWEGFFGRDIGVEVVPAAPPTYPTVTVAETTEQAKRIDAGYTDTAQKMAGPAGPDGTDALAAVDSTIDGFAAQPVARPLAPVGAGEPVHFHQVLSTLREHPTVLRALGLLVELRIPVSTLDDVAGGAQAQVSVGCPGLGALIVSPWTRYERSPGRFLPASTATIKAGMVDLAGATLARSDSATNWALTTVDVDGGALQLSQAASARGSRRNGDQARLPALRSAGLVLLRRNRSADFADRQQTARMNASRDAASLELDADQLTLGYRIDIKDGAQSWRSLHRRREEYLLANDPIRPPRLDEGHTKAFSAVTIDDGQSLDADEVVARWSGWSLAVEPPDLAGVRRRANRRRADVPYEFDWRYSVPPGSLPLLRFGHSYRVRVRVADAAGGGLGPNDPVADAGASASIPYARFEPILPPRVRPPTTAGPGESATRFVIRSDPATGLDVAAFSAQHPQLPATPRLTIDAPLTTLQLAEQHGFLDGADEATWNVARRAIETQRRGDDDGLPDPVAEGVVAHLRAAPGRPTTVTVDAAWIGAWPSLDTKVLRVLEPAAQAGEPVVVDWDDDATTLDVVLAPAAEATIELSSNLKSDFRDHFEIGRWLVAFPPTAATSGRHPMVTPPTTLQFVHAVRKPLRPPSGELVLQPPQSGETYRLFQPALDFDTASTSRLDIAATWRQWRDDPDVDPSAPPVEEDVVMAPVQQVAVARGPIELPVIRHELGDTRHRRVQYTVTAVSRFRDCFPADPADAEPDAPFRSASNPMDVDVLSSARPAAPVVLGVTPAFRWEHFGPSPGEPWDSFTHIRRGGRLRVRLARPWFTTGSGERLGVVVFHSAPASAPSARLAPFVSWLAGDPAVNTNTPQRWPGPTGFSGAAGDGQRFLPIAETTVIGAQPETESTIVIPYEVFFDGDHWYADVDLSAATGESYAPFAQLALVRYQPFSIDGHHISPIVHTDIVNVLPDRTLTVHRNGRSLSANLSGVLADSLVEMSIERAQPGAVSDLTVLDPALEGVAAWSKVPGLTATGTLHGDVGPLEVPAGERLRLTVREIAARPLGPSDLSDVAELTDRTVFIDRVELPTL